MVTLYNLKNIPQSRIPKEAKDAYSIYTELIKEFGQPEQWDDDLMNDPDFKEVLEPVQMLIDYLNENQQSKSEPKTKTKAKHQRKQQNDDLDTILKKAAKFIPKLELEVLKDNLESEEALFFEEKLKELVEIYEKIPNIKRSGKSDVADKTVYLHYFGGNYDAYILEINRRTGEAFALVDWWECELGYVSIEEIINQNRIELDLYFEPQKLSEIKKSRHCLKMYNKANKDESKSAEKPEKTDKKPKKTEKKENRTKSAKRKSAKRSTTRKSTTTRKKAKKKDTAKAVEHVDPQISVIRSFYLMLDKPVPRRRILTLYKRIERYATERIIRKKDKYAEEIEDISRILATAYNNGKDYVTISIEEKDKEKLKEIAYSQKVRDSVRIIKSFISFLTNQDVSKAERILERIDKALDKGKIAKNDPYYDKIEKIQYLLEKYLDTNKQIKLSKSQLSGLFNF